MNKKNLLSFLFALTIPLVAFCEQILWKGKVNSNGFPTEAIKLNLGQSYKIKVSGTVNLGKWRTDKKPLENDACFEFFADPVDQQSALNKIDTFRNSLSIPICENGKYQVSHIYESKPFTAEANLIHFWLHDIDFEDNTGELDVEIIQTTKK